MELEEITFLEVGAYCTKVFKLFKTLFCIVYSNQISSINCLMSGTVCIWCLFLTYFKLSNRFLYIFESFKKLILNFFVWIARPDRYCYKRNNIVFCSDRRTVVDPQTGQDVVLSDKDIDLIQRMLAHKNPDPNYEEYPVSVKGIVLFSVQLEISLLL